MVLGGDVTSHSLENPGALTHCFSRAPPDSPTSGIRAVVRLGGGAGVDP
ncbi:hypothetical protein A2U01_0068673, partial [Trifolium medium]|nr:hypothetical protein [Trifolium medium]